MKLSEMARKAKEKLIGTFSRKRQEENGRNAPEIATQEPQEGQQDTKTDISAQEDRKGQETANTEPTGQEETVLGIDMASGQDMTAGTNIEELMKTVREILWKRQKMGMTETQIRKRELWKRYYEEKAKMSNNERRRRGIPMVRRPKRQQYRAKRQKKAEAGKEPDREEQEDGSGQQDGEE